MTKELTAKPEPGDRVCPEDKIVSFPSLAHSTAEEDAPLIVPPDAQLALEQPRFPRGRIAFRRRLSTLSPLPLREVAWTDPFSNARGGECVVLVKNAFLDQKAQAISRSGQLRLEVQTVSGQRVHYAPPVARRRFAVSLVIATICVAVAVTMILAVPTRQASIPAPEAQAAPSLMPLFERPGMLAALRRAADEVPEGAVLSAIAAEGEDSLTIEFTVQDPDTFRPILKPQAREIRQSRLASGGYQMIYAIPLAGQDQSAGKAPVLRAKDADQAMQRVTIRLRDLARREVLQIATAGATATEQGLLMGVQVVGPQSSVLSFVSAIESGQPAMRFVDWRVENHSAGIAMSGELLVPWQTVQ
ncbi:MAG: hypothetical protein WA957_01240 [Alteraurantiacibacter sp.]